MICKLCKKRGQDWNGDAPSCAFDNDEKIFNSDNWNCAICNAIRDFCNDEDENCSLTDRRYCDDQKYASICIDGPNELDTSDRYIGLCLWVTWYKRRGKTDQMWILDSHGEPRRPTESECLIIIEYLKKNVKDAISK